MSDEVLGLIVNDGYGLCLKAEGDLQYTATEQKNGFFTSIAEKAIDLDQLLENTGEEDDDADANGVDALVFPTVRLETSTRSLLISKFETDTQERTIVVSKRRHVGEDA